MDILYHCSGLDGVTYSTRFDRHVHSGWPPKLKQRLVLRYSYGTGQGCLKIKLPVQTENRFSLYTSPPLLPPPHYAKASSVGKWAPFLALDAHLTSASYLRSRNELPRLPRHCHSDKDAMWQTIYVRPHSRVHQSSHRSVVWNNALGHSGENSNVNSLCRTYHQPLLPKQSRLDPPGHLPRRSLLSLRLTSNARPAFPSRNLLYFLYVWSESFVNHRRRLLVKYKHTIAIAKVGVDSLSFPTCTQACRLPVSSRGSKVDERRTFRRGKDRIDDFRIESCVLSERCERKVKRRDRGAGVRHRFVLDG